MESFAHYFNKHIAKKIEPFNGKFYFEEVGD